MRIAERIESIRKQPDHVRLRWVWGSVAFSMLVILAIWIFSITVMFRSGKNDTSQNATDALVSSLKDQTEELGQQTKSLKNFNENISPAKTAEGVSSPQENKSTETERVNDTEINLSNQSQQYSNLENQSQ
jgi:hypothetical protein